MDFGALCPEINSGLMYAGAGAGPMMAAAAAWSALGAELATTASSYEAVISLLTGDEWLGPASATMAAAAAPYVAWLNHTAAAAEHAAVQAMASAAAYEAAFAMTVPPPVIAANRTQLAALVATNFLGQNTPAIMATEAHYAAMWAQDAAAMYGYAAGSHSAGVLQPMTSPAPIANGSGIAAQAAAVGGAGTGGLQTQLSQVISGLQTTVGSLASPLASASGTSGSGGILSSIDSFFGIPFVSNATNGAVNTSAWFVMNTIPTSVALGHTLAGMTPAAALADAVGPEGLGAGLGTVLAGSTGPAGFGGAPVLAGLGQASAVGGLSVPAGWSAATPAGTGSATLAGTGWSVAAEEGVPVATMPAGMPSVASAGRGSYGFAAPRYGFKPTVMPKTVLV
ncbi:PPE family protein [Mycobacterium sp.]|uniref:PPE family protein n=1 Tax=Mycobacterium sp. TaxID=1785 RepID=UPI003D6A5A92